MNDYEFYYLLGTVIKVIYFMILMSIIMYEEYLLLKTLVMKTKFRPIKAMIIVNIFASVGYVTDVDTLWFTSFILDRDVNTVINTYSSPVSLQVFDAGFLLFIFMLAVEIAFLKICAIAFAKPRNIEN